MFNETYCSGIIQLLLPRIEWAWANAFRGNSPFTCIYVLTLHQETLDKRLLNQQKCMATKCNMYNKCLLTHRLENCVCPNSQCCSIAPHHNGPNLRDAHDVPRQTHPQRAPLPHSPHPGGRGGQPNLSRDLTAADDFLMSRGRGATMGWLCGENACGA